MKYGKDITLLACVIGLSGCATMVNHTKLSDEEAYQSGWSIAVTEKCAAYGHIQRAEAFQYVYSVKQYLGATVHSSSKVEQGYSVGSQEYRTTAECNELSQHLPQLTTTVNSNYARAQAWAASTVVPDFQASVNTFNQSIQSYEVPAVTFGLDSPNTNHYLVNTPNGQRQCSVSDSGYVHCN